MLTTAGGIVLTGFADGTAAAYDDTTLDQLWKVNVGSGINAPSYDVRSRRQTIRCLLDRPEPRIQGRLVLTPELREMRHQTMLFVFGL
jgi:hypothetical protein